MFILIYNHPQNPPELSPDMTALMRQIKQNPACFKLPFRINGTIAKQMKGTSVIARPNNLVIFQFFICLI